MDYYDYFQSHVLNGSIHSFNLSTKDNIILFHLSYTFMTFHNFLNSIRMTKRQCQNISNSNDNTFAIDTVNNFIANVICRTIVKHIFFSKYLCLFIRNPSSKYLSSISEINLLGAIHTSITINHSSFRIN